MRLALNQDLDEDEEGAMMEEEELEDNAVYKVFIHTHTQDRLCDVTACDITDNGSLALLRVRTASVQRRTGEGPWWPRPQVRHLTTSCDHHQLSAPAALHSALFEIKF